MLLSPSAGVAIAFLMPNKLTNLTITEGSLVDAPANKGARVMLFKRDTSAPDPPISPIVPEPSLFRSFLTTLGKKLGWSQEEVQKMGDEMERPEPKTYDEVQGDRLMSYAFSAVMDAYYMLHEAFQTILASEAENKPALLATSMDQFVADAKAKLTDAIQGVEKAGAKISAERMKKLRAMHEMLAQIISEQDNGGMQKAAGGTMAEPTTQQQQSPEDILKSLPENVRELVQKAVTTAVDAAIAPMKAENADLKKKAEDAETIAKQERDARELQTFTKKAETELPYLPGESADEKGRLLKALYSGTVTKEDADKIAKMMASASEMISKGNLFKELGRGGSETVGSAFAKLEAIAVDLVAKGQAPTKEQGIAKAAELHPELYATYQEEQRTRSH